MENNFLRKKIKSVIDESINEGIFDDVSDFMTGAKGFSRGYGREYFSSLSKLRRLIKNLKKLDEPNLKVINELENLKTKVQSLNIPQNRKQAIVHLIENSVIKFNEYNMINDQILRQIETINLDSWK
jgi:hypothetical protein